MHAKFNLELDVSCDDFTNQKIREVYELGKRIFDDNSKNVQIGLDSLKDAKGRLDAEKIIKDWFPSINNAHVFLSHSHKDEKIVFFLAGLLNANLGINYFIDSSVWGYSNDLLKIIDDEYCKNRSGETYDYDRRNRSTAHVHMMLSNALMNMIDRCECIIFLNTEKSFTPHDYINGKDGSTESPWIYSELSMTRLIQTKTAQEHRPRINLEESSTILAKDGKSELNISYPVSLLHLTDLSMGDIFSVIEKSKTKDPYKNLDLLYQMKRSK